jgi:glycosyltransferase involved in cell wall biosynthesis
MKKKPFRVLQVVLAIEIGGLETFTVELSKQLAINGIEVEILCLSRIDPGYVAGLKEANIPIHLMRKKTRGDLGYFQRVANFIKERNFDIIHSHSGCFFNAALFRKLAGVNKYIFTAHGMPVELGFKARCEDIVAGLLTDHFVSVSHEIEGFMKKRLFFNCCCFHTIINGINTDKYRPVLNLQKQNELLTKYQLPTDCHLVGSVGRLESVKNYSMLVRAFAELQPGLKREVHLVLVGEGAQKNDLLKLAEQLKIKEYVHFLGMQYNVHEILPLLDVFVLSSLTEGTSISLLEAQSCGVPAVVTDVGGNGFVVPDGVNGFLCPVNDHSMMAACIGKILEDQALATTLSQNARDRIESSFSIHSMVEEYEQIYAL